MKKILILIIFITLTVNAYATLTVGNVPVTKTGGSNPALQDSDITDDVGVGVAVGVPMTVQGSSVCTTGSVCSGYQASGSYLTSVVADSPLSGSGTSGSHLIFTNPGYITGNETITLTGYVTGSGTTAIVTSMPTINSNVGSFTNANITVNAQGQVTAASTGSSISAPVSIANGGTNNTSLTTGSVLFYDGTKVNQDNTNFFWDDTNNRIGIGTSSPSDSLDVRGRIDTINLSSLTSPSYLGNASNNSIAFGYSDTSGAIEASGSGSTSLGYTACSIGPCGVAIKASGNGSLAGGYSWQSASGGQLISSTGSGSLAWGYMYPMGNSDIISSGPGSTALGAVIATFGANTITSSGTGSLSFGEANGAYGQIKSSGNGSLAGGYSTTSNAAPGDGIKASSFGSIALGANKPTSGSGSTLFSTGTGSVAMGYSAANNSAILSSGSGSIAMGYSTTTLQATGTGSVAIGQDVQATSTNSMVFGNGVTNNTSNSLMIGFSGASTVTVSATNFSLPQQKATTGQRYACIDTSGNIVSSTTACSGT